MAHSHARSREYVPAALPARRSFAPLC